MTEGWDTEWRNDDKVDSKKTEFCRRRKVIGLVEELVAPGGTFQWTIDRALSFFDECFPISRLSTEKHLRSMRVFCEWLQKRDRSSVETIKVAAQCYSM